MLLLLLLLVLLVLLLLVVCLRTGVIFRGIQFSLAGQDSLYKCTYKHGVVLLVVVVAAGAVAADGIGIAIGTAVVTDISETGSISFSEGMGKKPLDPSSHDK